MAHYRERLNTYYEPAQVSIALAMLDALSHGEPLTFDLLFDHTRLRLALADSDAERVRSMVTLLQRDHYLILHPDGRYGFHFTLIRRWWALHRP